MTKYSISFAIILTSLTKIPILIFYTINPATLVCSSLVILFQQLNTCLDLIVWSVIPSMAMFIFSYLTICHIRKSVRILLTTMSGTRTSTNEQQKRTKFIDRQFIRLSLFQSLLFGLTSACGAIGGLFGFLKSKTTSNVLERAQNNLINNILSFIGLFGPCLSFYLCTLSSQLFRSEIVKLFRCRWRS